MHPASAKWYDRRDSVFIEFCVVDSKDVNVSFDKTKFIFSCVGGTDNVRHENEIELFEAIDENESKHKRTDRSVSCYLRKAQPGKSWPRLTKEKSQMMNNMGGGDFQPDLDGDEDDDTADSDDEKMPDLE
ncbi:prostaglandin E synthase 3-like isoform X2 [Dunckerocampus dactyliophorus]|uniref:prostaglandin E synthase 3-like isoform X2 n=1 Tax=Dunckerocampus dactyliophorus TaxID=161453 RepID=UPI002404D7BB|nr:prostaglandin E synthase 3-like isoform X2 [Dunckerocampus dactyliophorus]